MAKVQKKKNSMKKSNKPFKMKSSPFKIAAAIAAFLTKYGLSKATATMIGKAGQSIATNLAVNAVSNKMNKNKNQDSTATAYQNFANINFGDKKSSFTMKKNIKK